MEATRRRARPQRDRSLDLGETIVRAAMELFLEKGFSATTVGDIAAKVRMSKATFYARFPSKAAVLEAGVEDMAHRLMPEHPTHEYDDLPFPARLERIAEVLLPVGMHPEAIGTMRLIMAETYNFPQLATFLYEKGNLSVVRYMREFFDDAAARGDVGSFDSQALAEEFTDIMTMFPMRAIQGVGPVTPDEAAVTRLKLLVRLFAEGAMKRS